MATCILCPVVPFVPLHKGELADGERGRGAYSFLCPCQILVFNFREFPTQIPNVHLPSEFPYMWLGGLRRTPQRVGDQIGDQTGDSGDSTIERKGNNRNSW